MTRVVGVDPGASGAAALVVRGRVGFDVLDWLTWEPRGDRVAMQGAGDDVSDVVDCVWTRMEWWAAEVRRTGGYSLVVERIHPTSKAPAGSIIALAESAGAAMGVLGSRGEPVRRARASAWRADVLRLGGGPAAKLEAYAVQRVMRDGLTPVGEVNFVRALPRLTKVREGALAEAVCMGVWGLL